MLAPHKARRSRRPRSPRDADLHSRAAPGSTGALIWSLCSEPGFKTRLAEFGIIFRNERSLLDLDPVVARVRVGDDLTRIFPRGKCPPDEFIQAKLFRPSNFHGAIHG